MYYVELMRARRVLFWYTIIVVGIAAIVAVSVISSHGAASAGTAIPLGDIVIACTFGAYLVATIVSTGLVSEGATVPITWTRPASRERIAWSFIATDLATILAGYVIAIAATLLCIAVVGLIGDVTITPGAGSRFVLGLGSAVMWYALTCAVSARMASHGVRIAALSWFAFLVIGVVWAAPVPGPIHAVLTALNYINPIAYVNGIVTEGQHARGLHPIPTAEGMRIALEWIISAVALVAATRLWSTREA